MLGHSAAAFADTHHRRDHADGGIFKALEVFLVETQEAHHAQFAFQLHTGKLLCVGDVGHVKEFGAVEGQAVGTAGHGEELPVGMVFAGQIALFHSFHEHVVQGMLFIVQAQTVVKVLGTGQDFAMRTLALFFQILPEGVHIHIFQHVAQ